MLKYIWKLMLFTGGFSFAMEMIEKYYSGTSPEAAGVAFLFGALIAWVITGL